MDKNKGLKVPVQIRVNMWLGLSAHEKKFNSFSEGTFSVFAELVRNSVFFILLNKSSVIRYCSKLANIFI